MSIAAFDIGGSAVKYGLWTGKELQQLGKFKTPASFAEMVTQMKKILATSPDVLGIAISSPGAVNVEKRQIDGISAVPYLHHRPIFDEFEQAFSLPVTIENDANCAGICEMEIGAGKNVQQAVFMVIGSGVGGAIFINGDIYKGAHLFGGEFGLMKNTNDKILSINGTAVHVAERFSEETGKQVSGIDLFELKEQGDKKATAALETMYEHIAQILYNIQVSIDPEMIILGGGISARAELATELSQRLARLLDEEGVGDILPEIVTCHYQNNANLIGAALNFEKNRTLV